MNVACANSGTTKLAVLRNLDWFKKADKEFCAEFYFSVYFEESKARITCDWKASCVKTI